MDAVARSRLLRWLFLLGPAGTLVLFGMGIFFLRVTGVGENLSRAIPNTLGGGWLGGSPFFPAWAFVALGWLFLTLGCSAGTCLRAFRKQGKTGTTLIVYMLLATPLLALAHIALIGGVAFAGCLMIFNTGNR